ncbi:frpr-14 [Pristionchus pacificus]|nr:frpr-14 [Pristionchus pacificus]
MESAEQVLENMPETTVMEDDLLICSACQGSTDPFYQTYNLIMSGCIMALIGIVGLGGNCLVVRVYLSRTQRIHSSSIYLAALACSDFFLILTALFLFVLEAWRHHNQPSIAWLYVNGTPFIFPLASVFQTSSVYFCVAAAVDCFISVVVPSLKGMCCTPHRARITVLTIMGFCLLYNIPHVFEVHKVSCWDDTANVTSSQICPTTFRQNVFYYTVYYTYMYTTFMAVGPLLLLIVINICVVSMVVYRSKTRPPAGKGGEITERGTGIAEEAEESDLTSLILVVFFFIFCNSTALFVNFLEMILAANATEENPPSNIFVYLVDFSNLLIVVNGTANFFCYLLFGASFKRTLKEILNPRQKLKLRVDESNEIIPVGWKSEPTKLEGAALL